MEQYISDQKVLGVEECTEKTPAGGDMVKVIFDGNKSEIMPKLRFELIATSEVSDATTVMNKILSRVGAVLFGTLHEYGIKWGEVNQASDAMVKLCENGMAKASDILFGFEKPNIPLNKINQVLLENNAKENNNESGPEGSGPDSENKG